MSYLKRQSISLQLSIRINELENKRQFKCTWVNGKLKEEVRMFSYSTIEVVNQSVACSVTFESHMIDYLEIQTETI